MRLVRSFVAKTSCSSCILPRWAINGQHSISGTHVFRWGIRCESELRFLTCGRTLCAIATPAQRLDWLNAPYIPSHSHCRCTLTVLETLRRAGEPQRDVWNIEREAPILFRHCSVTSLPPRGNGRLRKEQFNCRVRSTTPCGSTGLPSVGFSHNGAVF